MTGSPFNVKEKFNIIIQKSISITEFLGRKLQCCREAFSGVAQSDAFLRRPQLTVSVGRTHSNIWYIPLSPRITLPIQNKPSSSKVLQCKYNILFIISVVIECWVILGVISIISIFFQYDSFSAYVELVCKLDVASARNDALRNDFVG